MKSLNTTISKFGQKGFTLIELIITIVIIGVLAAVAIPKFLDLSNDAEKGVAAGVGAALASGTSVNQSNAKIKGSCPVHVSAKNSMQWRRNYPAKKGKDSSRLAKICRRQLLRERIIAWEQP